MRTREDGHTMECLAHAMICAIENHRDALKDAMSERHWSPITRNEADLDFRITAQDNYFLTVADDYLADGTVTCRCPDLEG